MRMRKLLGLFAALCAFTGAQGKALASEPRRGPDIVIGPDERGPARVFLPDQYTPNQKWPLMVLLHGYTATGTTNDGYLGLSARVSRRGFILVVPEGVKDDEGKQFWNATSACCAPEGSTVDDVAYLTKLVDHAQRAYNVDAKRVYVMGQSNGGYMSYRMACETGIFAGVVNFTGLMRKDMENCQPSRPTSVLHIHGTGDSSYYGGRDRPSANDSVSFWAKHDQCGPAQKGPSLDLDSAIFGKETETWSWPRCVAGTNVSFWIMHYAAHIPVINGSFIDRVLDWTLAQKKR